MDLSVLDENNTEEDLYSILGASESSSVEQIKAEFKFKVKQIHPDKVTKTGENGDTSKAVEEFNRLRWAYEVLSNDESRKKYDHWQKSGLAIPFKRWLSLRDAARKTLHWASKSKSQLMLMETENAGFGQKMQVLEKTENADKSKAEVSSEGENLTKSFSEKKTNSIEKRTLLKRTFKTWTSSGISSKFQKYEI